MARQRRGPRLPDHLGHVAAVAVAVLVAVSVLAEPGEAQGPAPAPPPLPVITSVAPAVVRAGGRIVLRGRDFVAVRSVTLAGLPLRYDRASRRRIVARAPASATRGTVSVATAGGVASGPRAVLVVPLLEASPERGPAGSEVILEGSGFLPGEPVDLFHGRLAAGTITADQRGRLSAAIFVVPPQAPPGPGVIRAQGRFSGIPVEVPHTVDTDWPQRGYGPNGNRYVRAETTIGATNVPSLVLDWVAEALGPSSSSPAVVGDTVYVGADTGALLAIPSDCASGGAGCTLRALGVTEDAIRSSPAVAEGRVYVGADDGRLYAFDATCPIEERPCPPLWTGMTDGPVTSSPVIAGDLVIVGSQDGSLYAFPVTCGDTPDCAPAWRGATNGAVRSSPAVHDGVAYVGSEDGSLYAFPLDCARGGGTCPASWRGSAGSAVRSSPAVANGIVYVGTMAGRVLGFPIGCAEGGASCEAIWVGAADGPVVASPVVAESRVVIGTMDGSVLAFAVACADREVGCPPLWTASTGGPVRSSAAVGGAAAGGAILFVGSDDGFIYAYRLSCSAACDASWASGTRAAISASPALVDGVLYVSSEDGTVRAWSLP